MEAIEAMRVTLGPGVPLSYTLQGLFHLARKAHGVCLAHSLLPIGPLTVHSSLGLSAGLQLPVSQHRRCHGN
ncbi:hypothetical protein JVT61DRAFT_8549 [Boletus reticuloceps]|uniref:Uncharacterized protein n=1 Tax=Boletus reticuloceps TaxID=495285 RepID=A0A8I2YW58_9AGAM|nr:hypothetical protein JVT61DRAFT_8549 [Boletus reticuloceps]